MFVISLSNLENALPSVQYTLYFIKKYKTVWGISQEFCVSHLLDRNLQHSLYEFSKLFCVNISKWKCNVIWFTFTSFSCDLAARNIQVCESIESFLNNQIKRKSSTKFNLFVCQCGQQKAIVSKYKTNFRKYSRI